MAPVDAGAAISVEVVYGPLGRDVHAVSLQLPAGSTVAAALTASGLLERYALGAPAELRVGVWGRAQPLTQALRDRDRVEIYRPLTVDPKEARRLRYRGKTPKT